MMLRPIKSLRANLYSIAAILSMLMPALSVSALSDVTVAQSGDNPIVFDQAATTDNLVVLMAAGAAHNEGLTVKFPSAYPKHFWINNFNDTSDVLQWTVSLATAADYHVEALLSANAGETFQLSVLGTSEVLDFSKTTRGWTKQAAGVISLPAGTHTLQCVRTSAAASAAIKSLELIRDSDRADYLQRIADFKVDTTWFSQAGYGLMFQYGNWGYPESGDRKSLEDQTDDFDVPAFVAMVKGTGASYVIWSLSWWDYLFNAPIASVDAAFGHGGRTSTRDLVGDIMTALDAEGIDFMLYYHRGHVDSEPWYTDSSYPKVEFTTRGTGDRSLLFNHWETIITEIGNRYGDKLDGWFFDDGVCYYPAPFERLGAAARAGNPNRFVCYNPWIATRVTDFQDVMMGEDHQGRQITGSAGVGGDGILTDGPSAGLLQHGMFTMENDWGVHRKNQPITTRVSASQAIGFLESASPLNVPLSFAMMMWEDGSVSQDSLAVFDAIQFGGAAHIETSSVVGLAPQTVSFDASGTTSASAIVSYAWDFGDGNSATGAQVSHTYTTEGDYVVTLLVTDVNRHTASVSTSIKVYGAVVPALSLRVDTQQLSAAPVFSSVDLAQTQYLSSSATGDATEVLTSHAELFNGLVGNADSDAGDPGEVTIDTSNTVTVVFDTSMNAAGYDITKVDTCFGWMTSEGGRSNQGYMILVTGVDGVTQLLAGPTHWEPNSPAAYWTTVSFTDDVDGVLARGVKSMTLVITEAAAAGGVLVAREIDIFGDPTTGYSAWLNLSSELSDASFEGDPDGDSIATGLEYVLNGDPTAQDALILPTMDVSGGNCVFAFIRRAESVEDTIQIFQYSSTLQPDDWTDINITEPAGAEVTLGTSSDGLQPVTIVISHSVAADRQLFGRLKVVAVM